MFELDIETETKAGFCEIHGDFENVGISVNGRIVWSGCTLCGIERLKKENEDFARTAKMWRKRKEIDAAGIPKRFKGKDLNLYKVTNSGQKNALETSLNFVRDFERNIESGASLLFYGLPGTGKTHLAAGIGLEFIAKGRTVIYARAGKIIREVKDTWSKTAKVKEGEVYSKYAAPDLLIVDEIGRQFGTDSEKMILFEIINERYEQSKPIVAVTNLDGPNLSEFIGTAALDRLKENGEAVCFDWCSMRSEI